MRERREEEEKNIFLCISKCVASDTEGEKIIRNRRTADWGKEEVGREECVREMWVGGRGVEVTTKAEEASIARHTFITTRSQKL